MKRIKSYACAIYALVALGLFDQSVLSQFHVKPKIEINVSYEDGHENFLKKIGIFGKNENVIKDMHTLDIKKDQKKYLIYNVLPGKYIVSFSGIRNSRLESVFIQYRIKSFFDVKRSGFGCESYTTNEIEIQKDRNLKLDLVFKLDPNNSGFYKETEIHYKDFDYTKLIFFSKMENENLEKSNTDRSNILQSCDSTDICGDTGGECERIINGTISFDNGNIEVKINNFKYKNTGISIVSTGTNGVGEKDPNTLKWTCGVTTITHADVILCPNDTVEGCNDIIINYECNPATKRCKFKFEYNLKIEMKINVWNPQEMCTKLQNIAVRNRNYNLDLPSPTSNTNCCWLHRAVKYHESLHCKLWTMNWDRLRVRIKQLIDELKLNATECMCDDDCITQSKILNEIILAKISEAMTYIYKEPGAGSYQEGTCYAEQDAFFLRYVNRPCQL